MAILPFDDAAVARAAALIAAGQVVAVATETVYGLAADATRADAVARIYAAKGRPSFNPLIVHVLDLAAAERLAVFDDDARALAAAFWPGPLTVVCRQQPSLHWDLGDAKGTVAVRMPDESLALELLSRHGPLAVSSANRSGLPPAATCDEAVDQLGDAVAVYLDNGPSRASGASTIVDLTGSQPRILREGVLPAERLRQLLPDLVEPGPPAAT